MTVWKNPILRRRICGLFVHVEVVVAGKDDALLYSLFVLHSQCCHFDPLSSLFSYIPRASWFPPEQTEVPLHGLLYSCFFSESCSPGSSQMNDEEAQEVPSFPQCIRGK